MKFLKSINPFRKSISHYHGKRYQPLGRRLFGAPPSKAPKDFWRRQLWYLNPKRFRDFWLTTEGRRKALRITGVYAGTIFVFIAGLFLFYAKDLPSPGQINSRRLAQTTKFYDRTGKVLLYEVFGDQNRVVIDLEQISPYLKNATIAVEDKNFYNHRAFSSVGIVRAAINNGINKLLGREGDVQGGSTITQQYVKNALLSPERTLSRKIKELILAIQIEELYEKDDILELYLNEIPYGALAYGAQAASQTFFSKDAKDLTVEEAALLAALPRAPTFYSPYGQHTDELVIRQQMIIDLMVEQGYISREEADAAKKVDIIDRVNDNPNYFSDIKAPHFVLMVQEQLEEKYGSKQVSEGGLQVITTLDYDKQKIAEEAMKNGIGAVERGNGDNAALVAADNQTGQVLAMVGSRDFNYPKYGSFNAALAGRQPGSSFKPYGYAALFQTGKWGPGSVMYDVRTDFGGGYVPNNFDNRFKGAMTIRNAIGESRNIPAVKALYIAGVDNVINLAHKMGITTLNEGPGTYGLSLVLGAGEVKLYDHVNGYTTFAAGGIHRDPVNVLKVTDPKGKVLEEWKPTQGERVLEEDVAGAITDILQDDVARTGTFGRNNRNLTVPGRTLAVKTGTTDQSRDGWMMGFSTYMTVGVWVGNHDNRAMHSITSNQTGPIWTEFVRRAHEGLEDKKFARPASLKTVTLDSFTGRTPDSATRSQHTDVFPSKYQAPKSEGSRTAEIDTVSGKLATECTPPLARKTVTGGGIQPEIPPDDPAYGRWNPPVQALAGSLGLSGGGIPTEKDDVHKCSDDKPEVTLEATEEGSTGIVKLTADVESGTFKASQLDFKLNGQIVSTMSINGSGEYSAEYRATGGGSHTFTAIVTDDGLYQGEGTDTVNVSGAAGNDPNFSLVSPVGGTHLGNTEFKWKVHADANKYRVYWSRGGVAQGYQETSGTSYDPPGNLSSGSYTWYVEAYYNSYKLQTSETASFSVL